MLPFGAQGDVFKILADSQEGDVFEVSYVKNDKGYNDWLTAERDTNGGSVPDETSSSPATAPGPNRAPARSNYETPEERQLRQVYIVRQSSITAALSTLSIGQKAPLNPDEVIAVAKIYESFVFNGSSLDLGSEQLPPDAE